ncbi:S8 family serine peptidase [Rhodopirellula baltica]|uniref:Peptidase S8 and S53 subtilisin kexin sedolisin n=1 Tax=Rhodopirellula baltica SWK14 TaxID=993516 RepID=L7C921_RHOBT|nr:S8 family serine peptidase [Rhodopirellula baltica]ELP30157.1 peptidase S8 and S53 subtilisin kexin sedolisin [Rhodopirellula baltica SWK14]
MSEPTFTAPQGEQLTGKYVVTFRDDAAKEGMELLQQKGGKLELPDSKDAEGAGVDVEQLNEAGGAYFSTLGVAVVTLDEEAAGNVMGIAGADSSVLDVEPERMFYALADEDPLPLSYVRYMRGYRDAVNTLYDKAVGGVLGDEGTEAAATFFDDAQSTWGLKATGTVASKISGKGIKVAVLDTGMDLAHPDFTGRSITHQSFIPGETVQDKNGHGTHCIGTACGRNDNNGRRYGVAGDSEIFVGKVLSNAGSGPTSGILAGMDWAIANRCEVISMSLGNSLKTKSTAYERVGRRALNGGCLIVAAAGNHRLRGNSDGTRPGLVGQPANSDSILAVAAVDNRLSHARFSCESGASPGANVNVAGPGVAVYSSWPATVAPNRYHSISGTSMATPHVSGIAALYAEAFAARGAQLWQLLVSRAQPLPLATHLVGSGLVQAPI